MIKLKTFMAFLCLIFSTSAYATNYDQQLSKFEHQFSITDTEISSTTNEEKSQITCLALNIYFEARGTIVQQQTGVAWVVKNRARSDRYQSHNMCDVVFERYYGAPQFTWTSGQIRIGRVEAGSWHQAQQIAKGVYYGTIPDPTNGARSFHELSAGTGGARGIRIGTHVFYNIAAK